MKRILTTLILSGVLSWVNAQEAKDTPDPKNGEPETVSRVLFSVHLQVPDVLLRAGSTPVSIPRIFYDSPTGIREVPLYRGASTPLFPYQGTQPLTLYDIKVTRKDLPPNAPPGSTPEAIQEKIPVVKARFDDKMDRIMLLVFAGKTNPDGTLQTIVLPYNSSALKEGMSRVYNGTNRALAMQFESREGPVIRLEPNGTYDFKPSEITNSDYPRVFVYGTTEKGEVEALHTSKLYLKDETTNIFLVYDKGRSRVNIQTIGRHDQVETDSMFPAPTPTPLPEGQRVPQGSPNR